MPRRWRRTAKIGLGACLYQSVRLAKGSRRQLKIMVYSGRDVRQLSPSPFGAVAQLIERVVRNDEVVGLIPICSTILVSNGGKRTRGYLPTGSSFKSPYDLARRDPWAPAAIDRRYNLKPPRAVQAAAPAKDAATRRPGAFSAEFPGGGRQPTATTRRRRRGRADGTAAGASSVGNIR